MINSPPVSSLDIPYHDNILSNKTLDSININIVKLIVLEKKVKVLEDESKRRKRNEFYANCVAVSTGIIGIITYVRMHK